MSVSKVEQVGLNPQQQEAVGISKSALVLAGAGTGKTRVIAERISHLLENGTPAESIMAVTFTNKAANEMRERIGSAAWKIMACTFHSFGVRLLRAHAKEAGLPASFQILDANDQVSLVRRILQEDMGLPKRSQGGPDPQEIRSQINRFKESGWRPLQLPNSVTDQTAREAYDIYETRRLAEGKADFAELLLRTRELLDDEPEIRKQWSTRFSHILIDELQDINQMQLDILKQLKRNETVFFGVGDDDQSIYRFRGAVPRMLNIFANEFTGRNVLRLEQNYRSTDGILELANAVIERNSNRIGKTLKGESGKGDLPSLTRYGNDEEEARSIGREIGQLHESGVNLNNIAVLYRNHALAQLVEASLIEHGVPFRIKGGARFFARAEIKNAVSYLQAAAAGKNIEAILRSINMPPRKIGTKLQDEVENAASKEEDIWAYIASSDHAGMQEYVAIIDRIRKHAENNDLVGAAKEAVSGSGLQKYLKERNEQERAENLDEIINAAARFQEQEEKGEQEEGGLEGFLANITLDPEVTDNKDQITLTSIHSAKGLEFDYVFLIGLEQNILPGMSADYETLEEECRLLYVAITRAQRHLHMSYADMRRKRGAPMRSSRTQLLNHVDAKLLKLEGGATSGKQANSDNGTRQSRMWPRKQPPRPVGVQSLGGLKVGQKVLSQRFGPGVVLSLAGSGDKAKVQALFFRDRKQRWMILKLAKLKPLS